MNKLILKWSDIDSLVLKLQSNIDLQRFEFVYGVPRGGLILAVMLSHRLNLKFQQFLSTDNLVRFKTLICDEIVDTGTTIQKYTQDSSQVICLHKRKISSFNPEYVGEVITDEWVIYPWETFETPTEVTGVTYK